MIGSGRKKTPLIEVYIEVELALTGRQLRCEPNFIVFIDGLVKLAEIFLHGLIQGIQFIFDRTAISVICRLCRGARDLCRFVLPGCCLREMLRSLRPTPENAKTAPVQPPSKALELMRVYQSISNGQPPSSGSFGASTIPHANAWTSRHPPRHSPNSNQSLHFKRDSISLLSQGRHRVC